MTSSSALKRIHLFRPQVLSFSTVRLARAVNLGIIGLPWDHQNHTALHKSHWKISAWPDKTQNFCLGRTMHRKQCCPFLECSERARTRSPSSSGRGTQVRAGWTAVFAFLLAQMLALINKHYLKDPSSPVKCPLRGWLAPASQGTEYLIIALNE